MSTRTVSQLDEAGYYVGEAIAHESPLEPGVYLIPGGAIDRRPPRVEPGRRYRPWGTGWRGEDLPAPPAPAPAPEPEPAPALPSPEDVQRAAIAERLQAIDQASIRPARAVAAALAAGQPAPPFEASRLAALEAEAASLRAELKTLS